MSSRAIWKGYAPIIVLVPALVGIHYGWFYLQQNDRLVPKSQQLTEQPIVSVSTKRAYSILFETISNECICSQFQASKLFYQRLKNKFNGNDNPEK